MDDRFEETRRAAHSHFWYHGFRRFVTLALDEAARGRSDLHIVDCGCGLGHNFPLLAAYGRPVGFELEPAAAVIARQTGYQVLRADITRIPLQTDSFDVAVSFDVLQCVDADVAGVREMARVVRPGGRVVLMLAALNALFGDHSEIWAEYRRYTPRSARQLAESAGLDVERVSFAFAALFPLLFVVRTTQRLLRPFRARPSHTDIEVPWAPLNAGLSRLLDAEAALARYVRLPIGSSLIVIARKPVV